MHPADYVHELPTPEPSYDTAPMRDIDDFVEHRSQHLLFVYGEWDPWTGGRFALGNAIDATLLIQPRGTHGAQISNLEMSDRDAAFARLEAWTGVTPVLSRDRRVAGEVPRAPRIPPALVRALHARK